MNEFKIGDRIKSLRNALGGPSRKIPFTGEVIDGEGEKILTVRDDRNRIWLTRAQDAVLLTPKVEGLKNQGLYPNR